LTRAPKGLAGLAIVGAIWTFIAVAAQAVMKIAALVILARLLSPREFGIFVAAMAVLGFCAIFSELGVGPAIVQRKALEDRHIRAGFTLSLLLSFVAAVLIWYSSPALAEAFKMAELVPVLRAGCLVLAFQGMSAVAMSLAQRELRFRWLAGIDAGAFAVGYVIVGASLAWLGLGVWALVGAVLTQHLLRMIMLLVGQPHLKRPLFDRATIWELLYFGTGFSIARIGNYLAGQGDNLVVGRLLGAQALGIYGYAYQLMNASVMVIGQVLDRVLFPTMALVQLEAERLARAYRKGCAVFALLILPVSIVITQVTPEIVIVLLGAQWLPAAEPLQILALAMIFRSSAKISDSVARATGAVYARAWRQWIFALAIVSGSLIGQHWGLTGVSFGVLAAIIFNSLLMVQLSLRLTGMSWRAFGLAYLPALALSVVIGAEAWFLADWLRSLAVPSLPMLACVALVASSSVALLWWVLPSVFLGHDARALLGTTIIKIFQNLNSGFAAGRSGRRSRFRKGQALLFQDQRRERTKTAVSVEPLK
jgi:PST family polysaccharide transporter